ncbi:hypothetical protein EN45_114070 [Penicillium chrysogenum]|uniref:Uncharacterized protein n=1 Tax=Penicillium chrysogenum TaxID=5076 RepID=A0A167Q4D8_PENCH|nr:hypothetical protein EN45_114070 [Penicillium chrysogenum]
MSTLVFLKLVIVALPFLFAGSGRAKDGYGISPLEFQSKEEQMAFYDGHDVEDPQGLLSWQDNLIQEICPKRTISISNADTYVTGETYVTFFTYDTYFTFFTYVTYFTEQQAHHTAEAEIQPKADDEYYTLQSAFSASDSRFSLTFRPADPGSPREGTAEFSHREPS